ncbi:MAG TPA: hypothetical protein P5205_08265 [Candidatus Paceibacterota bacterium]|nr:hypothetical protein [Verrucomicrobiota bacterium]HSA10353.1 hypothetical protein [Candidatus Paceibacterota bacterium]
MKKKRTRKPKAGMSANPADREALRLRDEALAAIHKLAACARTGHPIAANWLGSLPMLATDKAIAILRDAPNSPNFLGYCLAGALTDAVARLTEGANARPAQFQDFADHHTHWPMLRELGSRGGRRDTFPALSEKIGLGANLGLRRDRQLKRDLDANGAVASAVGQIAIYRKMAARYPHEPPTWARNWGELPPLTGNLAALRVWWKELKPLLEDHWRGSRPGLARYTKQGQKHWDRYKLPSVTAKAIKPDLRAKNLFLTACRKALERMAPPITHKRRKRA